RIPHSALGGEGRGGEDRRRVRHAAPRLGGCRLQERGRREGRGSGVRRGPALLAQGHDVLMVGVADQLAPVLERLATFQPKLVFNGCESFRGHARHEYALATVLEMHGYRYTGSSPTGLLVARNKSLTKKILAHHEIRVPAFAEFRPGE